MNCKQAKQNMERLVFGGLREDGAAQVREHVRSCKSCAAEQLRFEKLKLGLEQDWPQRELPAAAETLQIPERDRKPRMRLAWVLASCVICAAVLTGVLIHSRTEPVTLARSPKHKTAASEQPNRLVERTQPISNKLVMRQAAAPEVRHRGRLRRPLYRSRLIAQRHNRFSTKTIAAASSHGWEMSIEAVNPVNKQTILCCRKMNPDGTVESTEIQTTMIEAKGGNHIENSNYTP